jgi:hypothetical protein
MGAQPRALDFLSPKDVFAAAELLSRGLLTLLRLLGNSLPAHFLPYAKPC